MWTAHWVRKPGIQHLMQEAVKCVCVLTALCSPRFPGRQSAHSSRPKLLKLQIICRALVTHISVLISKKTVSISKQCLTSSTLL